MNAVFSLSKILFINSFQFGRSASRDAPDPHIMINLFVFSLYILLSRWKLICSSGLIETKDSILRFPTVVDCATVGDAHRDHI